MRVMIAPLRVLLVAALLLTGGQGQPSAQQQTAQAPQPPSPLQQLAAKFAALSTDEQRKEMAAANPELLTAEAAREVIDVGNGFRLPQNQGAQRAYEGALWLGRALSNELVVSRAYAGLGVVAGRRNSVVEAMGWFEQAIDIARRLGDAPNVQRLSTNLAIGHRRLGDLDKALAFAKEAVAQAEVLGDRARLATALTALGQAWADRHEMANALDAYARSLELRTDDSEDTVRSQVITLMNVGNLLNSAGDLIRADEYYRRALARTAVLSAKSDDLRGALHANLGHVQVSRGNFAEARRLLKDAMVIAERTRDLALASNVLHNLANISRAENNAAEAIGFMRQSLAIREQGAGAPPVVEALSELGRLHTALDQLTEAEEAFARAQQLAVDVDQPQVLAQLATYRGEYFERRTRWADALEQYEAGKRFVERMRTVTTEGEARQAFLATRLAPYLGVASVLASSGRPLDALLALEDARARSLRDTVDDERTKGWLNSKADARTAIAGTLPAGSGAIEFVVEPTRVWVYLVKASAEGLQVRAEKLAVPPTELTALASRFADAVANRDLGFAAAGQRLYEVLLGPYEAWLADVDHLVLVPDDVLWRVPFQALRAAGQPYLIERMTVSYTPSLFARATLAARAATRPQVPPTLLALGDPDLSASGGLSALPEARREVTAVAKLYGDRGARVFVGEDATPDAVRTHASSASVVHIATHGVLEDAAPMSSYLQLAGPDGRFEARQWLNLTLSADLVVLSACQTARGALGGGEGIVGQTWGVFAAGASTAIVSQWEVDSASTTSLMIRLHQRLTSGPADPLTPAEALRAAARSVLADARYRHPFYWAGFVAIGR